MERFAIATTIVAAVIAVAMTVLMVINVGPVAIPLLALMALGLIDVMRRRNVRDRKRRSVRD